MCTALLERLFINFHIKKKGFIFFFFIRERFYKLTNKVIFVVKSDGIFFSQKPKRKIERRNNEHRICFISRFSNTGRKSLEWWYEKPGYFEPWFNTVLGVSLDRKSVLYCSIIGGKRIQIK